MRTVLNLPYYYIDSEANRYSILLQGVGAHGGVQIKLLRKHLHHVAEVSLAAESFMIYLRKTRTWCTELRLCRTRF